MHDIFFSTLYDIVQLLADHHAQWLSIGISLVNLRLL